MAILVWFIATEIRILREWRAKQRTLREARLNCPSLTSELPPRAVKGVMRQRGSAARLIAESDRQ